MERFANFPSSPSRPDERDNSSTTNSPTSSNSYNGYGGTLLSRPVCRSESNPHPTTFVQADSSTFKQVVQMLTGSGQDPASKVGHNNNNGIPPIRTGQQKKQGFKLYERRNSLKYELTPLLPNSRKNSEILSPTMLDFPSLALMSPVTPLTAGEKVYSPPSSSPEEEEKAIAHKGFYLHPSPGRTANEPPRLLSLFPVTSSSSSPAPASFSHSKT